MQVRRVFIVLSVILLAVNVLFFIMLGKTKSELSMLSDSLVENASAFFTARGTDVPMNAICREIPDHVIYSIGKVTPAECAGDALARLSGAADPVKDVILLETPDGVICRVENGVKPYLLRMSQDAFSFVYARTDGVTESGAVADEIMPYFENDETALPKETSSAVRGFWKHLVGKHGTEYAVCGSVHDDEKWTVCIVQCIGDTRIRDCFVCVSVSDGSVTSASGRVLFAAAEKKYHETLIDGVNALRATDLSHVSAVYDEQIVYSIRYTDAGVGYLVPVWEIRTADAENAPDIRYVDAIDGNYVN